jgi:hypothetical protein
MEICWDNLEKMRYNKDNGLFYYNKSFNNYNSYIESDYVCIGCKQTFIERKWKIFNKKVLYCSLKCKAVVEQTGRTYREETKIKMSNSKIGINNGNWKGGYYTNKIPKYDIFCLKLELIEKCRRNKEDSNILEVSCTKCDNWFIPTYREVLNRIKYINRDLLKFYCSKECKQECSIYNKRKYPKGFKPTTSREVQPELRKLVFERDNWLCVKCGIGENLHCHHIDPVICNPIESADIDNCITLCKKCHKDVHKKGGCKLIELRTLY